MNSALLDRFGTALVDVEPADEAAWHAWRAGGIGASECASVLGINEWETPYELYQRKIGALPPRKQTEDMILGLELEPVVLSGYARKTNRKIIAKAICLQHPKYPFIRATLDAIDDADRNVEAKTTKWRYAGDWGQDGDPGGVPERHVAQVQHQNLVAGTDGVVAVLIGGEDLRTYEIESNPMIHDRIIRKLSEFWECVQNRTPPPMKAEDDRIVGLLAPERDELAFLTDREQWLAELYDENRKASTAFDNAAEAAKAGLIRALDGASRGVLPDGRIVSRSEQRRAGHFVNPYSFYDFHIRAPKGR